jgi:hypothetical protein
LSNSSALSYFGEIMREVLLRAAAERVKALETEAADTSYSVDPEGMFGTRLAEETLETADACVKRLNGEILRIAPSEGASGLLTAYAASIRGALTFRRVAHASSIRAAAR